VWKEVRIAKEPMDWHAVFGDLFWCAAVPVFGLVLDYLAANVFELIGELRPSTGSTTDVGITPSAISNQRYEHWIAPVRGIE
jgi:hypothetical protein